MNETDENKERSLGEDDPSTLLPSMGSPLRSKRLRRASRTGVVSFEFCSFDCAPWAQAQDKVFSFELRKRSLT